MRTSAPSLARRSARSISSADDELRDEHDIRRSHAMHNGEPSRQSDVRTDFALRNLRDIGLVHRLHGALNRHHVAGAGPVDVVGLAATVVVFRLDAEPAMTKARNGIRRAGHAFRAVELRQRRRARAQRKAAAMPDCFT